MDRKNVLIKTALIEMKAKFERTLAKHQKSLDTYIGNNSEIRARKGIRGGRATTITGKIDQKIALIEQLKKDISILDEEIANIKWVD